MRSSLLRIFLINNWDVTATYFYKINNTANTCSKVLQNQSGQKSFPVLSLYNYV